ncbi:hypothetical protein [Mycolicibacterium phocaicum]|nr:hypothetical protein [Mycolicibacterium phocaicum]BBZ57071.1 hypothetical protein MPHO_40630 [Mycolicibacterium phocaicum]
MPERADHEATDDKPPPTVTSLKSGLGWTDPDRHHTDPYPPHWGFQRDT